MKMADYNRRFCASMRELDRKRRLAKSLGFIDFTKGKSGIAMISNLGLNFGVSKKCFDDILNPHTTNRNF